MMTTTDTPLAKRSAPFLTAPIDAKSRSALGLLAQAFAYAGDAGADVWDFAVEIDTLYQTGLSINDLRWLVAKKFAEHGQESSVYGGPHRSFHRGDGFFFDQSTCVVLTPAGAAFVDHVLKEPVLSRRSILQFETASPSGGEPAALERGLAADNNRSYSIDALVKPAWSRARRELSLRGTVVKRFRVPAHNQEMVLCAFEEEGWPAHIDDPIPVSHDIDPRTRLHDAIHRLNGRQTNRLVRFKGNGNGTGVFWELCESMAHAFFCSPMTRHKTRSTPDRHLSR
jgi:hypothetical protein